MLNNLSCGTDLGRMCQFPVLGTTGDTEGVRGSIKDMQTARERDCEAGV